MMRRGAAAVALFLSAAGTVGANCLSADISVPMVSTGAGPFAAALRFIPMPVKVGTPFAVDISLCAQDNARTERLVIDARMPAHRHGMNYKPEISSKGNGHYEARGFLFHMPGKWEIMLSVTDSASSIPHHFTLELDVR